MRMRFDVILFTVLGIVVGCSQSDTAGPKLVAVNGTVTLDAKPLANAQVTFLPTGNTPGFGSTAKTDAEGKYKLKGQRGGEGAVAGTYKVVISKRVLPDGSIDDKPPIESQAKEMLPVKYSMEPQSTLTATVPESGGTVDFSLKSR